jgi:hypothetical protein
MSSNDPAGEILSRIHEALQHPETSAGDKVVHIMQLMLGFWASVVSARFVTRFGYVVQGGPFAGMRRTGQGIPPHSR